MPDDPGAILPPTPDTVPSARAPKLVCEFCECRLAPNGDVMATSDRAKMFRDLKDRFDRQTEDLAKLTRERDDVLAKLRELERKSSSIFS